MSYSRFFSAQLFNGLSAWHLSAHVSKIGQKISPVLFGLSPKPHLSQDVWASEALMSYQLARWSLSR